jgi:hypothetical protein
VKRLWLALLLLLVLGVSDYCFYVADQRLKQATAKVEEHDEQHIWMLQIIANQGKALEDAQETIGALEKRLAKQEAKRSWDAGLRIAISDRAAIK